MKEYFLNEIALRINKLSANLWGEEKAILLIGKHPKFIDAQKKIVRYAQSEHSILINGETGVGKELFARSIYLFSKRKGLPFISINCALYQDPTFMISELFGHKKGSYTGAHDDRTGIFKEYDHGVIFLDEIGELSLKVQGMLLRVLSEGEIKPLGSNRTLTVNPQIIAATNRNLKKQVADGHFRDDLYYRLCQLRMDVPALRERGDDLNLLIDYHLKILNSQYNQSKRFSREALNSLENYHWPGNVRELKSIVSNGFFTSDERQLITPGDFIGELEKSEHKNTQTPDIALYLEQMITSGLCFWEIVQRPYLNRDLNRAQVRMIVQHGLRKSGGNYKKLLKIFNIRESNYLKFMDFLRHHNLKPNRQI